MKISDLKDYTVVSPSTTPKPQGATFGQTVKDLGIGVAKGLGDTTKGLANIGRPVTDRLLSALDPNKTVEDYQSKEMPSFMSDESLKSSNNTQKTGKAIEFVGEILFPVGKVAEGVGLTQKAGASLDKIGSRIGAIGDDVLEGGEKVKDKLIDIVGNLDDKTKTALQRTPQEVWQKFKDLGEKAMTDDRNRTPLEAVGDSVAEALKVVRDKASQIGAAKSDLIKLPEAFKGDGVKSFNEGLQSFLNNRSLIENDKTIVKQIVQQFKDLGTTPTKGQVDKFIDFAQESLYAGEKNLTLPASNKTVSQLRALVGKLNDSLKSQLPKEYGSLNDEYARLISMTEELNIKLGKATGNAGSLVKRLFSPSDARTKELFDALEKETGQDFFRDARVAKFVMEALGDARSKSLLEEIPTPTGIIKAGYDKARDMFQVPFKAAETIIKKNAPESGAKATQNFAGALGGVQPDEEGNASFDPVSAMLMMAGMKAGSGKKQAISDLIEEKSANLYLIQQRAVQLGEKVSKNLINTLKKELKALKDEFKKL